MEDTFLPDILILSFWKSKHYVYFHKHPFDGVKEERFLSVSFQIAKHKMYGMTVLIALFSNTVHTCLKKQMRV